MVELRGRVPARAARSGESAAGGGGSGDGVPMKGASGAVYQHLPADEELTVSVRQPNQQRSNGMAVGERNHMQAAEAVGGLDDH